MKKPFVLMGLALLAALPAMAGTWTGWVTDSRCGARGAAREHAAQVDRCLREGARLMFYSPADQKLFELADPAIARKFVGREVKISGELEGGVLRVESYYPTSGE